MKTKLLLGLLYMTSFLLNAQTISNGLYVNKERNEFIIIRNDIVQFRVYNNDAFATFTIGEGVLRSNRKGKYIIEPSVSFMERTTVLYRRPRSDNELSVQIIEQDSLPMIYATIKITRLQDKKPYIIAHSDEKGQLFLDKRQIEHFDKSDVVIYANLLGNAAIAKKVFLEKGYDYIIKSRIPALLSGSIARGSNWEVRQLNEVEVLISNGKNIATKLKKITDDFRYVDFPFNRDVRDLICTKQFFEKIENSQ
jgi:hypothetical protein